MRIGRRERVTRALAIAGWGYLAWVLLTWTATVEVLVAGAVVAIAAAGVLAPLGSVARPWSLVRPHRLAVIARLTAISARQVIQANLQLTRFIWQRHPPLSTGMVITDTRMSSDGGFAAVGILTSLIVDNQVVDADPDGHELLYHVLQRPAGGRSGAYRAVNGPLETRLAELAAGVAERDAGAADGKSGRFGHD